MKDVLVCAIGEALGVEDTKISKTEPFSPKRLRRKVIWKVVCKGLTVIQIHVESCPGMMEVPVSSFQLCGQITNASQRRE